jgi:integrase
VSEGEDLYTVGKLLGHTQVSTTRRYAHLANKPLKKATMLFGNKITRLTSNAKPQNEDNIV